MGPRFLEIEKRRELAERVNRVTGAGISPDKSYPSLKFSYLLTPKTMSGLLEALDWMVEEIRRE